MKIIKITKNFIKDGIETSKHNIMVFADNISEESILEAVELHCLNDFKGGSYKFAHAEVTNPKEIQAAIEVHIESINSQIDNLIRDLANAKAFLKQTQKQCDYDELLRWSNVGAQIANPNVEQVETGKTETQQSKNQYDRETLIQICKDAVVHHKNWSNRDSFCAQKTIQDIYKGLTAGLTYTIDTIKNDINIIWIEFIFPIDFEKLKRGLHLDISSREDYFRDYDPKHETEMFDGGGIDFHNQYTQGYMPTRHCLDIVGLNNDWY